MKKFKTKELILCAVFAALLCAGAYIRIPTPLVPMSLQSLIAIMAGFLLGGKLGAVSAAVYLLLGLIGLPVFTGGGGLAYVLKPSFGYIIGFIFGALAAGAIAGKREAPGFWWLLMAAGVGTAVIYAFGFGYFAILGAVYLGGEAMAEMWPAFLTSSLMALPGDTLKCLAAAALSIKLIPAVKKLR